MKSWLKKLLIAGSVLATFVAAQQAIAYNFYDYNAYNGYNGYDAYNQPYQPSYVYQPTVYGASYLYPTYTAPAVTYYNKTVVGKITQIDGYSVTIRHNSGKVFVVNVSSSSITVNGYSSTWNNLTVGSTVTVTGTTSSIATNNIRAQSVSATYVVAQPVYYYPTYTNTSYGTPYVAPYVAPTYVAPVNTYYPSTYQYNYTTPYNNTYYTNYTNSQYVSGNFWNQFYQY